ncbi:hypothetical protein [Oerskovia sp. Root22]|uniref:hypothetical protein n=1 Tax=Oerskovia sp. Root22 TaxID=1736494 RepID=UPI0012FB83C9|nr:hypothetical protein [Oerskovia sp. Root22]
MSWIGLIDSPQELTQVPLRLDLPAFEGTLHLGLALKAGPAVGARDTLASLVLHDSMGPLGERSDWDQQLRASDVHRSANPTVGHYRYLWTVPGKSEVEISFKIPAGLYCSELSVRKYGEDRAPISIMAAAYRAQ